MGLRDIHYDIGPFVTLIDGASFTFQWNEREKLLRGQIHDADRVAISRTDTIGKKQIEQIKNTLDVTDGSVLLLSTQDSSIDELVQQIISMDQVP